MADDYKYRPNRSNEPYRRGAEPPRASDFSNSSDPLAELARLIGQNDPFADGGRGSAREPQLQPRDLLPRDIPQLDLPQRDFPPRDSSPRDLLAREVSQRDFQPRDLPPRGYSAPAATPEWPPSLGASGDRRYDLEPRSSGRDSYPGFGDYAPSRATGRDPIPPTDDYLAARGSGDRYASPSPYDSYAPPVPAAPVPREELRWPETPAYADPHRYDEPASEQGPSHPEYADRPAQAAPPEHAASESEYEDEQYYQDDAPLQPEDEDAYDDAPRTYRRGGIATALALIGCALLGTAGAYAYRSYAHPTAKEPPPVITADQSTTKVVPAAPAEAKSNKPINERFATAGASSEQLVSRQEEPVAVREPGTAAAPRVVLPAPVQPAQPAFPPVPLPQAVAPTASAPATTATTPGSEPKRVRTVTIRPDGADPSGRPVAAPTTPPAPRATATTPPAPRAVTPPAPRSGGPLSLEPNDPRSRTANAPPSRDSLSSYSPSGGYVVQLSSQKTQDEAHSSFRALQGKFPNELGNRQVIIRRADLGAKGVVYRTNVGPFGTAQEAQRFCSNYKAAGGQCIVPTN